MDPLPSTVAPAQRPGRLVDRSTVLMATWAVPILFWLYYLTPVFAPAQPNSPLLLALSTVPAVAAIAMLLLRRRMPVATALVIGGLLLVSPGGIGAAFVAQATVARRTGRAVAVLTGGWLALAKVVALLLSPFSPTWDQAETVEMTIAAAGLVVATLLGWLDGSRAAESHSRADADRARSETERSRLEQARLAERERIAREMHDVLAHRLSLVAMHAGVLAFRTDLTPEQTRETAEVVQRNARQSLDELRSVLSTLRGAEAPPEPPQPTLAEVAALVADPDSGKSVDLSMDLDPADVPTQVSRHAYRIIQEALTNARKHAPGAPVTLVIDGTPSAEVRITVSNPLTDPAARPEGSGFGLLGVTERATAVGGRARSVVTDGRFILQASLPWKETP